ncbi:hypothetical protein NKDENANG_03147 [Candidatus Entotheonellaceae bacterium PAL068K]
MWLEMQMSGCTVSMNRRTLVGAADVVPIIEAINSRTVGGTRRPQDGVQCIFDHGVAGLREAGDRYPAKRFAGFSCRGACRKAEALLLCFLVC